MDRDGLDDPATDAELLAAARSGDQQALETLWTRHEAAVRRYARQLARPSDVDELVSESFYRVLKAILDGGGPDTAIRAYLLTTLRRVSADLGRGYHQRVRLTGDDTELDAGAVPSAAEVADENAERGAAWRAWQSLPEESRTLLRQLIIEERTPAELAPLLGTTANGVSSRGLRARERLRQAYLQQQLQVAQNPDCSWARSRLGEYTRHALARREQLKVQQHLAGCASCSAAAAELADLNRMLRTSIAPVLLGGLLLARNRLPLGRLPSPRLPGTRLVLASGTIAAAVLLVPLVTAPAHPHQQVTVAPVIAPVRTNTATTTSATSIAMPELASTPAGRRPSNARRPVGGPTSISRPVRPSAVSSPARTVAPKPSSSSVIAAPASMPVLSAAPTRPTATSGTSVPSASAPDTRSPATLSSPASAAGVSRTVPLSLAIGGRRWLPGVLTVTVPKGWTIDSLSSTGRDLPCTVESSTIADCRLSGPANRSYCFRLVASGPVSASADDRLIASYASAGVTLLDLELPLT